MTLEFPVFNTSNTSFKHQIARIATGGLLRNEGKQHVAVRALEDISLNLHKGDRVAIFGNNGSGKSTLLRLLSGVYYPLTGSAKVNGKVSSLIDIGLGINVESTGRENLFLRGAILGFSKKEMRELESDIIEFSELGDFIDLPVRTYSSGMQLRLAFAVSTVVRPQILLMDEWLSVGDEQFREKAENRLLEIVLASEILVLATHSRALALKTCNKAVWLDHGRIVAFDSVEVVASKYFK